VTGISRLVTNLPPEQQAIRKRAEGLSLDFIIRAPQNIASYHTTSLSTA